MSEREGRRDSLGFHNGYALGRDDATAGYRPRTFDGARNDYERDLERGYRDGFERHARSMAQLLSETERDATE